MRIHNLLTAARSPECALDQAIVHSGSPRRGEAGWQVRRIAEEEQRGLQGLVVVPDAHRFVAAQRVEHRVDARQRLADLVFELCRFCTNVGYAPMLAVLITIWSSLRQTRSTRATLPWRIALTVLATLSHPMSLAKMIEGATGEDREWPAGLHRDGGRARHCPIAAAYGKHFGPIRRRPERFGEVFAGTEFHDLGAR